jgi:hypothetical protein
VDFAMWNVLRNNPMFAGMDAELSQILNSFIDQGLDEARLGMSRAQPGDRLYSLSHRVMEAHGFSKKQRENARIYIANGPINAYTVSGTMDRPFVVMFTGLLDSSDTNSLTGVLGHEFGHIVNEHVLQDVLNMAVLNQLGKIFVGGREGFSFGEEDIHAIVNLEESKLPASVKQVWQTIFERNRLKIQTPPPTRSSFMSFFNSADRAASNAHKNHTQIVKAGREAFVNAFKKLADTLDSTYTAGAPQAGELLANYLKIAEATLRQMSIDPSVPDAFASLRSNMENGTVIKVDKDWLMEVFSLANAAWSREAEASSDFFGLARTQRAYAMDLIFSGRVPYSKDDSWAEKGRKLREYLKSAYDSVAEFYAERTQEERNQILGGNPQETHPNPNLRAIYQANVIQSVEITSQANAFQKLLVFEEVLKQQAIRLAGGAQRAKAELPKMAGKIDEETKGQIESQIQRMDETATKILADATRLRGRLIELIKRFPLDGANPYLANLLDYKLASRQLRKAAVDDLLKKIGDDSDMKQQVEKNYKASLTELEFILTQVAAVLREAKPTAKNSEILAQRIKQAELAMDPTDKPEAWAQARTEISQERIVINNLRSGTNKEVKSRWRIEENPVPRVLKSEPDGFPTKEQLQPEQPKVVTSDFPPDESNKAPAAKVSKSSRLKLKAAQVLRESKDICFDFLGRF